MRAGESATMSKSNGRHKRAIENLAAALNECFEASSERAAEKAAESVKTELKADMHAMEARLNRRMDIRLDKQDDTLRMIWTQCGGKKDQRLPIDG